MAPRRRPQLRRIIPGHCSPCELLTNNKLAHFEFGGGREVGIKPIPEDEGSPTVRRVDLWPETRPGLVYYIHTRRPYGVRIMEETSEGTMTEIKEDLKWAKQWRNEEDKKMKRLDEAIHVGVDGDGRQFLSP